MLEKLTTTASCTDISYSLVLCRKSLKMYEIITAHATDDLDSLIRVIGIISDYITMLNVFEFCEDQ